MDITALKERLAELNAQAHDLQARAQAEKRDLSVEETAELDATLTEFDRAKANIDRLEKLQAQTDILAQPAGRRTQPNPTQQLAEVGDDPPARRTPPADPRVPAQYRHERGNGGFRTLGEFGMAVANSCKEGGVTDPRLERLAAASTFGSEGQGADGGFAVPPDFRASIMQTIMAEDSLLSRCDQITCAGNTFTCPVDETSPWQTSGGILATWDGESAAATQTKPNLQERTIKLNKLRALVPLTEELLEDASAMDAYLRRKAPQKIAFKVNNALVNGTGAGQPLGLLNSPARVTVSKESGQQTGTIVAMNIIKMYNRMYGPSRSTGVWVYNQEVEPQLFKLSIPGTDNTGNFVTTWGVALYQPPNGLSQTPYGTLFGRPCIPSQACPALSTEGDILFVDFQQYLALLKSGPNPKVDVSMHLWFDQDLTAFKFSLRMGGMPWWSTTLSPLNGSNTYSPYVSLQSR